MMIYTMLLSLLMDGLEENDSIRRTFGELKSSFIPVVCCHRAFWKYNQATLVCRSPLNAMLMHIKIVFKIILQSVHLDQG
jgi:hypothetical protein